jgi:hypothetical protein
MTVAIRWAGDVTRAVSVICHSPALTGVQPGNAEDKRIFFCWSAISNSKKDLISLFDDG